MAKRRNGRQDAIRAIVRDKEVRTQRMLVEELKTCGIDCTQATVSRDIADMGLKKLPEGVYVLSEDLQLQRVVSESVVDAHRSGELVVLRTAEGAAPEVAAAIDSADLPGILPAVAGSNDAILVIAQTQADGERLEQMLGKLRSAR